jgi:thiamine-monophosphate kinase
MIAAETPLRDIGERALLENLRDRIPSSGEGMVLGLLEDGAVLDAPKRLVAVTAVLVEHVHFRRDWTRPRLLGRKAISVGLSNVGAMAGVPRHAMVSLILPADLAFGFVDGLFDGLLERTAESGVNLIGATVTMSPGPLAIDVTVLGSVATPLTRGGAQVGDHVVVTGSLGAAREGLKVLVDGGRLDDSGDLAALGIWTEGSALALERCLRAQLDPAPPLAFARVVAEHGLAHAGIDVSDGLEADLRAMCEASSLSATVRAEAVPVDQNVVTLERSRGGDALQVALQGGEDYQLLLAVSGADLASLRDLAAVWELSISDIGRFMGGPVGMTVERQTDTVGLATAGQPPTGGASQG